VQRLVLEQDQMWAGLDCVREELIDWLDGRDVSDRLLRPFLREQMTLLF